MKILDLTKFFRQPVKYRLQPISKNKHIGINNLWHTQILILSVYTGTRS